MSKPHSLNPKLTSLIDRLRRQIRYYVGWDAALTVLLVLVSAFWIGFGLDYLPVKMGGTEMPRSARAVLLIAVGISIAVLVWKLWLARVRRSLPDESLALLIERQHPRLGGRLVTAVQLLRPGRSGDAHDPALLDEVHGQAIAAADSVDISAVLRWEPIRRKAYLAAPLVLSLMGLIAVSPNTFGLAASRLSLLTDQPWPRQAKLEMIGVELPWITAREEQFEQPRLIPFTDGVIRLPRGSEGTLRIRAKASDGAVVPSVCTAYYWTDEGNRGQTNLRRVGREVDGYQSFVLDGPPLSGLSESMEISIHGFDDRLDNYRIEAVTPPAITNFDIDVRYPDYLRTDFDPNPNVDDLSNPYQAGLRIREGSRVTLVAKSSRPLGEVDVWIEQSNESVPGITPEFSSDRGEVRFRVDAFHEATTIRIVPVDEEGISAQTPYRYFLNVIRDEMPQVQLRLAGIGSAVTPIAMIPATMTARDDYGVTSAAIVLTVEDGGGEGPTREIESQESGDGDGQAFSVTPPLDRDGSGEAVLDLRDLVAAGRLSQIKPGGAVNVLGEAADGFDLGSPHLSRSEIYRLDVVTPERLLALLERRELEMRSRLEQTINETVGLRDALAELKSTLPTDDEVAPSTETSPGGDEQPDAAEDEPADESTPRQQQILVLRIQQSGLQAAKTSGELAGIVASLGDLLAEMINNRVDSVDRRERISAGVKDPLATIVAGDLASLQATIRTLEQKIQMQQPAEATATQSVELADQVLLKLTAVLEKMLDLESYNEILDLVRELIGDQESILDATKKEQKRKVLDLFE